MPTIIFTNFRAAAMKLIVEPWGDTHEVPHLASAGIRYVLQEGSEDRCYSYVSDHQTEFWCNAECYEIDVVHPSAFDRLAWDICVNGGCCGGMVGGEPTSVEDLLPKEGFVTAADFAKLADQAEGDPDSGPVSDRHLAWLEAKFIEHVGASSVAVENFRRNSARPFDEGGR